MVNFKRVKSGIPGMDQLMDGGIPEGNLVVLSGDPGSGKTIFCWQFLYSGALNYNEPGVYVSLEQSYEEVIKGASEFEWDLQKLVDAGLLKILVIELYDFERLKISVEDTIRSINAKRVVIDPGVIFKLFFHQLIPKTFPYFLSKSYNQLQLCGHHLHFLRLTLYKFLS